MNSTNVNQKELSRHAVEILFFIGGVIVIVAGVIFTQLCAQPADGICASFDLRGLVFAVAFSMANFRSWKMYVTLVLDIKKDSGQGKPRNFLQTLCDAFLLVSLKIFLIVTLVYVMLNAEKPAVISFLLGFTLFIFVGILLAALAGTSNSVKLCVHNLMQLSTGRPGSARRISKK